MSTWSTCLLLYCLRSSRVIKRAVILFPDVSRWYPHRSIETLFRPPPLCSPSLSGRLLLSVIIREGRQFMLAYHFCMVSNSDRRRSWYPDIVGTRMGSRGFLGDGRETQIDRDPDRFDDSSTRWYSRRLMSRDAAGLVVRVKGPIKATTREYANDHTYNRYVWILITPQVTTSRHPSACRRSSGTSSRIRRQP